MQLTMRQRFNQNGTTVRRYFSLFGFQSGKGGEKRERESEDQPCAGTAVTWLVFPLEAFDVKKTQRWKKNNSWRDAAPWVRFEGASQRFYVCARVKCMQVLITYDHAARTFTLGSCESFRKGGGGGR